MSKPTVKIFTTHTAGKESYILENEVFQPICNSIALGKEGEIPCNNTGDNIAEKGASYCELCTQYWAWKNVEADYYGFTHYRRFLSFADTELKADDWSVVTRDYLNSATICEFRLDDADYIRAEVEKYDAISMKPVDLRKVSIASVYDQYKTGQKLHIEDIDLMMCIIKEKTPQYYPTAKRYMAGQTLHLCNMFVMRKDLFQQYSEWLFTVLSEFEKQNKMDNYSMEGYRTPGHLGERLFGIFFTYLKEKGGYRLGERQVVMFTYSEKQAIPTPFSQKNNIPIIMSSSEFFAQFASAAIQSIVDHSSPQNKYDIIILVRNMSEKIKNRLKRMVTGVDNFSIRFLDVGSIFSQYRLYESKTISIETYYRLVIPEYFAAYDKVLYLDGDIIVKADVADLLRIDIGDNLLGGVVDTINAGVVNGFDPESEKYNREKLQLKNIFGQINAGVLIMNCNELRKRFSTKFLLNFVQAGCFKFQDQDALNVLCEGRIQYIDPAWNFFADPVDGYRGWIATYAPRHLYRAYREAAKAPKIIHYAGNEKPWWDPTVEWADDFWEVFVRTPFYHSFMRQRMGDVAWDTVRQIPVRGNNVEVFMKSSLIRRGFRCIREHGFWYTFKRLFVKVGGRA